MATDIDPGDPSQHDLWLVNITTKVYYFFFVGVVLHQLVGVIINAT